MNADNNELGQILTQKLSQSREELKQLGIVLKAIKVEVHSNSSQVLLSKDRISENSQGQEIPETSREEIRGQATERKDMVWYDPGQCPYPNHPDGCWAPV